MMVKSVEIDGRKIGPGNPVYIIAEIGINHNGDVEIAKQLIDAAKLAGCDAVKFQKRNPEKCVPPEQRALMRETPWGMMTYLEYRHRVEFGKKEYAAINQYCHERKIIWFASCWDQDSVEFMEQFSPPCYKVPSAMITDLELLRAYRQTNKPIILSSGMSTLEEIDRAVEILGRSRLMITQCTSTYPCKPSELDLLVIKAFQERYGCPIGYSGHEVGLQTTLAAVVLGACLVERHITLDRAMWGTDQAASVEPGGLLRLVRDIRVIEQAMGNGVKKVHASEIPIMKKLRRQMTSPTLI